jgi:hypothetical protein
MEASWLNRGGNPVPGPIGAEARILVAGDTHGNLDWIRKLAKLAARHGCDGIVQLGDFGFWPDQQRLRSEAVVALNHRWLDAVAGALAQHGVWMRMIDGNHDAHPLARACTTINDNGIRPVRDGVLDWADRGAVWTWSGVRCGALGGAPSIDRALRTEGLTWWATETIAEDDVAALADRAGPGGVDVLFTHDAPMLPPGIMPLNDIQLRAACATNTELVGRAIAAAEPAVLLHGHYHLRYSSRWRGTSVEGFASDVEAHRPGSWAILNLPDLSLSPPS